jgi:hypothetical protein
MERADWNRRIAELVRSLGDRDYQQRTWLERDPAAVSSPAEMCCSLCDDLQFATLLASLGVDWNAAQKAAGLDLLAAIEACGVADRELAPQEVLDHSEWIRVRVSAQRLGDLL